MEEEKNVEAQQVVQPSVETNNEKQSNKNNKTPIIIAVVVVLLLCIGAWFLLGNSSEEEKKNTDKEGTVDKKDDIKKVESNLDFDFDGMSEFMNTSLKSGNYKASKLSCTETPPPEEGMLPRIEDSRTSVSDATIDTVINKLKTAKSFDKDVTSSWIGECYPKAVAYIISADAEVNTEEFQSNKIFTLYYADTEDTLLVGYQGIGYAFHFNSGELDNFIESLK